MSRLWLPAGITLAVGVTILLSLHPWGQRRPMIERLRLYAAGGRHAGTPTGPGAAFRWTSVSHTWRTLLSDVGQWLARHTAGRDDLAQRLDRIGSTDSPASIRARQMVWAIAGLLGGAAVAGVVAGPWFVAIALIAVPAIVAVLVIEEQTRAASTRWQQQLADELPVVAEQLGMLLGSGYSLGAAMQRIAARGRGVVASGLAQVLARVRHGVSDIDALREWAAAADVAALDRLVSVLALNWEANDLGSMISAEARSMRREAHRRRLEVIERRGQQVWIPVTIATLVPGVIFMAVPFVDAMSRLVGP